MNNPYPPDKDRRPLGAEQDAEIERIVREHRPAVESFCRLRCGCHDDADDATAEVFLIAWQSLHQVLNADRPRAWLYAACRNVISNQLRSNARQIRLHERLAQQPAPPLEPEACDPRLDGLEAALLRLNDLDRELILLSTFEDLSPAQIATVLRMPPAQVRSRLHDARRRLRRHLDQQQIS